MIWKYTAIGFLAFLIGSVSMWNGGSPETYTTATVRDKLLMLAFFTILMTVGFLAGKEN